MIVWAKGGTASFVAAQGESVTLRSTIPSPPGSRLDATFADEPKTQLRVKVHSSKKQDDGSYTITGRLVDATRETRERVAALVSRPSPVTNPGA